MRNNTQFSKDQSHNYVVVNYDNVTEKGLKKLITQLKNAGAAVQSVEAPNKQQKKDGEPVKRAKFFFENGQTMTLFIGDHGDIFQMTMNSTKQPIPSVKNERELAKAMVKLMEQNQDKFDKAQQRKANRPVKDKSDTKPLTRTVAKRIEEAQEAEKIAQTNLINAQQGIEKLKTQVESKHSNIAALEEQLEAEKQETKALEAELEAI